MKKIKVLSTVIVVALIGFLLWYTNGSGSKEHAEMTSDVQAVTEETQGAELEEQHEENAVSKQEEDNQSKQEENELSISELDREFDNGSSIELPSLTSEKIEDLELLGRVWGFLKYHHPEIAKGTYHWDYELFRFLPKYMEVASAEERDQLLVDWIDSLGPIEEHFCVPVEEEAFIKPDLDWIEQQGEELKNKLLTVYNNRAQGKQYYIELHDVVGNPNFNHENAYENMPFPDDGFRLLSLYRYWNAINYFFPYKYLMDDDWNGKLKEYIPRFVDAKDELEYELVVTEIIGDVQDSHATLWGGADKIREWKGLYHSPVNVGFIENQLTVTEYFIEDWKDEVGLNIGDVITKVNGRTIEDLVEENAKYYPASNEPTMLRNMSVNLLRSDQPMIEIEVMSGDSAPEKRMLELYPDERFEWEQREDETEEKCYKMLDNNIGYVTLATIKDEDILPIKAEFKDTKGIIIDIRNYPATFVPFSLGSYFVSESSPFVKFTQGNVDNPGEFKMTPCLEIPRDWVTYEGKLIVLVNEQSQSQAEYTAMAFRAGDNTTIIGSTTAGADGNVSEIVLPGGLKTWISGIGVYYPDGGETQRIGIVPNIEVKPTVQGLREGRDELLEKAIEVLLEE